MKATTPTFASEAGPFNAASARAKRPCPLWVDAFQRDTQHLSADEVGVYMLLLMAMWTRESCDLPDDDGRLAKVGRISKRLWDSRIGPVLRPFFMVHGDALVSKRLRIEAEYVERSCGAQSERRAKSLPKCDPLAKPTGAPEAPQEIDEKPDKTLNNNNPPSTTDNPWIPPRTPPTQQPNNPTLKKEVTNVTSVIPQKSLIDKCLDHFNATAETVGWPKVQKMTGPRRAALTQRVKDCGGAVAWREAIDRAAMSPLLTGQTGRGWRADFDWICKPTNFTKLMEGNYDPPPLPPAPTKQTNGVKNERLAFDKAINAAIKAAPPGASLVDRSRSDPFAKR